ncbi:MAG: esterase-like activity of phytase family protein [Actinomycetota bacterium]
MRTSFVSAAVLALGLGCLTAVPATAHPHTGKELPAAPALSGFSVLPADTFVPDSEPSGAFLDGRTTPAYPGQPVQGFSGVHANGDGTYLAMSDNGFGNKANSRDFLLAVHRIAPDLDGGKTRVLETMHLSDPEGHIPWDIWRDGGCEAAVDLPAGHECPAPDRVLTGWDFDLESLQVARDGTLWFGDEFGPYLLHTDAEGRLLEAPIKLPGVTSPSDPDPEAPAANLANSKGFEGMAIAPNSRTLYPMLEGATDEDKAAGLASDRRIYEVALGAGKQATEFTGEYRRYRTEAPEHNVGDFIAVNAHQFLVIERDDTQGAEADFKRIYLVDIRDRDRDGYVDKRELVDLMDVADPHGLASEDGTYRMPYFTIEDVEILDENTVAVLNDNNYRATGGRGADVVDVTEFVTIDLPENLRVDHRLLPGAVEERQ